VSCGIFSNNVCVVVGHEGVIKGWTEEQLNMSRAVHYNPETGTFKVERSGVYFLYCQVSHTHTGPVSADILQW